MTATTGTGHGPLQRTWGAALSPHALRRVLLPTTDALPVPTAARRDVWALGRDATPGGTDGTGGADPTTTGAVLARAAAERGTPWPQVTAGGWTRYRRDGDRAEHEARVFARQERLSRAVVAAAATLEGAWLDEVVDGVVLLCEQSSWCWPAHDDAHARRGAALPTVTDPYLDLGAGEVAAQLAWTWHLLGAPLEERAPGLARRLRHEVRARVLAPYRRRRDWHWLGLDGDVHNWNPWILGNVVTAALVLVDDPDERAEIVAAALLDVDRYVASLPADGAVDEGFGYWWNGAARLLELLDVVEHATGGALDPTAVPPLREVVAFPHRMHLGGPWYLNLADGQARPSTDLPWHVLHRWGHRLRVPDAVAHAAAYRRPGRPAASEGPGLGRLLRGATDAAWCTATPGPAPLVRDAWFPSTQVLVARPARGDSRVVLAVKGGHNGEHHNHDDVGGVVVAADGVPLLVDPGRPTYTAVTFGPDRYTLWPMRSGWHNVPVVRGHEQGHGARHGARDLRVRLDEGAAALSLDVAGAYPAGAGVRTWRRTAELDRATASVSVTDAWDGLLPDGTHGATRLHWVVAGDVTGLGPGRAVVLGTEGAGIVLTWEATAARVSVEDRPLDDPLLVDVWGDRLHRLVLELVDPAPEGVFVLHVQVDRQEGAA